MTGTKKRKPRNRLLTSEQRSLLLCALGWSMEDAPEDTFEDLRKLRAIFAAGGQIRIAPKETA